MMIAGRWFLVATTLPMVWACSARTLGSAGQCPTTVETSRFTTTVDRRLDILFMVDNSQSMSKLQDKLLDKDAGFPVLMNVLKNLPLADGSGGVALPDIHVAVISSDVGPGGLDLSGRMQGVCRLWGDEGRFQTAPRAPCAVSPLPADQHFLIAGNNQAQKNYAGDITDAFTCIAKLGESGCGFEGQLKSVRWALDPFNAPPENQGFLREDATLAVILITNEDDCSMPDDSALMEPTEERVSDPLGPLLFRCNEYGHLCNIDGTLQPPPRHAASDLAECVSNDTATGRLTRVADEVAFLKSLKPDPNQIMVAAITGPDRRYDIAMVDQTLSDGSTESQPAVQHSCVQATGEFADPAIRIRQWVQGFGDHGLLLPICADSFAPALSQLGQTLATLIEPACIAGNIARRSSGTPDCVVTDRVKNDQGGIVETTLPACADAGDAAPCWSLEDGAARCPGRRVLKVNRERDPAPVNRSTEISCAVAPAGDVVGPTTCSR